MRKTRAVDEFRDGCPSQISTNFEDDDGSFGISFNVLSKKKIYLYGLDIHTSLNEASGSCNFQIYTINGNFMYDSFFSGLDKWSLVAKGTLVGRGVGNPTPIPHQEFNPVVIQPNKAQRFYITLEKSRLLFKDVMNSLDDNHHNDDFLIMSGSGVLSKSIIDAPIAPAKLFQGRMFYRTLDPCITLSPMPTLNHIPTLNPIPSFQPMHVVYNLIVKHSQSLDRSHVRIQVETYVKEFFYNEFSRDKSIHQFKEDYDLKLIHATTTLQFLNNKDYCSSSDDLFTCTGIGIDLELSHHSKVEEGFLDFYFLQMSDDITLYITDNIFETIDVGDKPVEIITNITLVGARNAMEQSEQKYFKSVLKNFLFASLESSAEILYIDIKRQGILVSQDQNVVQKLKDPKEFKRRNSQLIYSSLEIEAVVTGKYRPPPNIDFGSLVVESINAKPELLLDQLKNPSSKLESIQQYVNETSFFSEIDSITAETLTPLEIPVPHDQKEVDTVFSTNNIILMGIATFFTLIITILICIYVYRRNALEHRRNDLSRIRIGILT